LGLPTEQCATGGCLSAEAPVAISCWRTKNTINILVSKEECAILADRLNLLKGGTGSPAAKEAAAAAEATTDAAIEEAAVEAVV
jgi:hypothetical protein